jgi:hypothetical protein
VVDERASEPRLRDVVAFRRPLRHDARLPARLARIVIEARLPEPREVVHFLEPADAEPGRPFVGRQLLHEVDELALAARRAAQHEQVLEDGGPRVGRHRELRSAHNSPSAAA